MIRRSLSNLDSVDILHTVERAKPCRDRARFSILQCYIMDIASSHVVTDLEKSGTSLKPKISSPSVKLFFF